MELNFCEETTDPGERDDLRAPFSGEGPSSGPGADLEYDLWEGQFQFVGEQRPPPPPQPQPLSPWPPNNDRKLPHRRGYRLSEQVQMIQEQMDALADTKSVGEERYARAKQENATLQARILMLEEAAKDAETRAEERLQAEQRRHREWVCRLERERQLQLENCAIKLQAAELDSSSLREEITRVREQLERMRADKTRLENDLREIRREADAARESERHAISRANEAYHMLDAMREELSLRSEDQQRLEDLVQQVAQLQARNKSLEESRDELQAAAALQAGRELLMLNPCNNNAEKGPSLAMELLAGMNPDQIDGQGEFNEPCTMAELKQALKEQQEVNTQLRTYIDGILLNIVENYPQLLEVKQTH